MDDPVTGGEVGVLAEDQPGCGNVAAQHRQLLHRSRWQGEQIVGGDDDLFAPRAGEQREHDAVADGDGGDRIPDRRNRAHPFVSGDRRQCRRCEVPANEEQVVKVQRGQFDIDENLAGAGCGGCGDVDEFQHVGGVAEGGEAQGLHQISTTPPSTTRSNPVV